MRQRDLIAHIANELGMPQSTIDLVLATTFKTIADDVAKGNRVAWFGFGSFMLKRRVSRRIRNPTNGKLMWLPVIETLGFKCSRFQRRFVDDAP